ncbi:hypothetical protein RJ639_003156, partial [Escallonia herrerae]
RLSNLPIRSSRNPRHVEKTRKIEVCSTMVVGCPCADLTIDFDHDLNLSEYYQFPFADLLPVSLLFNCGREFLLEFYLLYAILVDCFSSSSCQFGDRCKFLHASQQQAKPNAFGFGTQPSTQFYPTRPEQQKPNPFGFGIQNGSQPRGISDIGAKQNQFKPFENKWTRFSPVNAGSSPARQPDSAASHTCPCDIVGDISYEELRAAAYTDAKLGLSLPSIVRLQEPVDFFPFEKLVFQRRHDVEKERNLLNSKLLEFESLLRNPCAAPPNSTISTQSPSAVASPNASLLTAQNSAPPAVSSFSQLGASLNRGFGMRRDLVLTNGIYVSQALFISSVSGKNNFPFGSAVSNLAGLLGGQFPTQSIGSSVPSSTSSFSNSGMGAERNHSSFATGFLPQIPSTANNQSVMLPSDPSSAGNAASESTSNSQLMQKMALSFEIGLWNCQSSLPATEWRDPMDGMPKKNGAVDNVIWLKDEWNPGEIPEEAPPDEYIS